MWEKFQISPRFLIKCTNIDLNSPPLLAVILFRPCMSLKPDERTSMEIFAKKTVYCERNTVVTVVKADRAVDTGTYKIRLVCEGGTFEVQERQNRSLLLAALYKNRLGGTNLSQRKPTVNHVLPYN